MNNEEKYNKWQECIKCNKFFGCEIRKKEKPDNCLNFEERKKPKYE